MLANPRITTFHTALSLYALRSPVGCAAAGYGTRAQSAQTTVTLQEGALPILFGADLTVCVFLFWFGFVCALFLLIVNDHVFLRGCIFNDHAMHLLHRYCNWHSPINGVPSGVGTQFAADYVKMVKLFKALPSKPKVFVVLPPPGISQCKVRGREESVLASVASAVAHGTRSFWLR